MSLSNLQNSIVGIVGLGVVGDGVQHYFQRTDHEIKVYDPKRGLGSVQ